MNAVAPGPDLAESMKPVLIQFFATSKLLEVILLMGCIAMFVMQIGGAGCV